MATLVLLHILIVNEVIHYYTQYYSPDMMHSTMISNQERVGAEGNILRC